MEDLLIDRKIDRLMYFLWGGERYKKERREIKKIKKVISIVLSASLLKRLINF